MTVANLIISLLGDIPEASDRTNISATILYLFDVYTSGKANDKEIEQSLYEICRDIISIKSPDLLPDEITAKAKDLADQFMREFRIEGAQKRILAKFRVPPI